MEEGSWVAAFDTKGVDYSDLAASCDLPPDDSSQNGASPADNTIGGAGTVKDSPPTSTPNETTYFLSSSQKERERAVRELLDNWVSSFKRKDLSAQVNCYAPEVDVYYRKQIVPRSFVEENKAHAFAAIAQIKQFELTDVNISFDSDYEATVTFDKTWDTDLTSGKTVFGI